MCAVVSTFAMISRLLLSRPLRRVPPCASRPRARREMHGDRIARRGARRRMPRLNGQSRAAAPGAGAGSCRSAASRAGWRCAWPNRRGSGSWSTRAGAGASSSPAKSPSAGGPAVPVGQHRAQQDRRIGPRVVADDLDVGVRVDVHSGRRWRCLPPAPGRRRVPLTPRKCLAVGADPIAEAPRALAALHRPCTASGAGRCRAPRETHGCSRARSAGAVAEMTPVVCFRWSLYAARQAEAVDRGDACARG